MLTIAFAFAGCTSAEDATVPSQSEVDGSSTTTVVVIPQELAASRDIPVDAALEIPNDLTDLIELMNGTPASVDTGDGPSAEITSGGFGKQTETPAAPSGDPFAAGYKGPLGAYGLYDVLAETNVPFPIAAPGTAPLTGLSGPVPNGPAVVVKIDNSSKARPQAGVTAADIVVEEEVEWGITRLAAIFHSSDATVGPVRSGRSTDISFLSSLGNPALVYSGANSIIDDLLLQQERVQNFSAARTSGYWRQPGRRAPSNLFADTNSFNGTGAPPPAWFSYRAHDVPSVGEPVTRMGVTFPSTTVEWTWNGSTWLRRQNGTDHVDASGVQISTANVVVAEVPSFDTGLRDSSGGVIPEYVWAGAGPVSVFTDGKRIDGQWVRPRLADQAVIVAFDGTVIELTPGTTWVELVEPGVLTSS